MIYTVHITLSEHHTLHNMVSHNVIVCLVPPDIVLTFQSSAIQARTESISKVGAPTGQLCNPKCQGDHENAGLQEDLGLNMCSKSQGWERGRSFHIPKVLSLIQMKASRKITHTQRYGQPSNHNSLNKICHFSFLSVACFVQEESYGETSFIILSFMCLSIAMINPVLTKCHLTLFAS